MASETETAAPRTVLITGASRGLGRELALRYAAAGWRVIACCRGAWRGGEEAIEPRALDVADPASIAALARGLAGRPIDALINNAAIRGDLGGLAAISSEDFLDVMRVNALAPLLMAQALIGNLRAGRGRIIANISSRAGSMAEGTIGDDDGDYAYRCSKAALNMATTKLAHDLRPEGIAVLSIHPGWVQTDMGGEDANLAVAASAAGVKAIIDRAGMADTGTFRAFDGAHISW